LAEQQKQFISNEKDLGSDHTGSDSMQGCSITVCALVLLREPYIEAVTAAFYGNCVTAVNCPTPTAWIKKETVTALVYAVVNITTALTAAHVLFSQFIFSSEITFDSQKSHVIKGLTSVSKLC
jgi:hypothetical protein